MSDRTAQARAEAERRLAERRKWLWETLGEPLIESWGMGFQAGFREAAEWADANPRPHTITHDDMGAAYGVFMDAEGHPVRRFIVALKAIGIEVAGDDE